MHIVYIWFACKNVKISPLSTQNVTDGAEPWIRSKSIINLKLRYRMALIGLDLSPTLN